MSHEWKPGDVARIRYGSVDEIALVRPRRSAVPGTLEFAYTSGGYDIVARDAAEAGARPLVVIDPEDREAVERLRDQTVMMLRIHIGDRAVDEQAFTEGDLANAMQAALREFANPTPPKPEEPTGLGAVVEDVNGDRFVRTLASSMPWLDADDMDQGYDYGDITAVRVLSAGVPA